MKKRFLITALLAVLAMAFAFTTCDLSSLLGGEKDDGETRELTFTNYTKAKIKITCQGSTPGTVILEPAKSSLDDKQTATVTREGKDIELTSLAFDPYFPDPWDWIDLQGSVKLGNQKKGDGIKLGSGTLDFVAASGVGYNQWGWKIDVIPQDK